MSSLTITLIQPNLHWEDKKANLEMLSEKIDSIKEKTEVVILPEMFSTGFSMKPEILAEKMNGDTIGWMKKITAEKKIILTGSIMIEDPSIEAQDSKYYNRLIWMLPNGEYGIYDKRHLFAYGDEHSHFSPGNKRLIASVKGWKINLQVCYDLRFPVWARQGAEKEYDVLIYVANWPQKRSVAWKTLLQARAIENQCYVIGVNRVGEDGNGINYSGDSMIVDSLGEILYQKNNEEDIFTYTLKKEKIDDVRDKFPFWKDADSFIINS
ncbi:MAG: amidohydrolase [Ginsengibacter sp.]